MSVHLVINERRLVVLDLKRGCRRNAEGGTSNDGQPQRYVSILDQARREGAEFADSPYIVAEVVTVHSYGCAATRHGKKHGPCDCGGDEMFHRFVEAAGDPWELPEAEGGTDADHG